MDLSFICLSVCLSLSVCLNLNNETTYNVEIELLPLSLSLSLSLSLASRLCSGLLDVSKVLSHKVKLGLGTGSQPYHGMMFYALCFKDCPPVNVFWLYVCTFRVRVRVDRRDRCVSVCVCRNIPRPFMCYIDAFVSSFRCCGGVLPLHAGRGEANPGLQFLTWSGRKSMP
jgi:hypothetical protein